MWAMDVMYVKYMVGVFGTTGYPGYPFADHGAVFAVACWAIGLMPLLWLPLTVTRPSQVLTWCAYLMVMMPTAIVAVYGTQDASNLLGMLVAMTGAIAILNAVGRLPALRIAKVGFAPGLFAAVIIGFSALTYIEVIRTYGTTMRLVGLADVYTQRMLAFSTDASQFVKYLLSWQGLVVNPFITAIGIARRRPLIFIAGMAGQLFLFAVAAQRILLVLPFMGLGLYVLLRRGGERFGLKAAVGSTIVFAITILLENLGERLQLIGFVLFSAFPNRLFMNGGFLTVLYFKFFGSHPNVHFANAKLIDHLYRIALSRSIHRGVGVGHMGFVQRAQLEFRCRWIRAIRLPRDWHRGNWDGGALLAIGQRRAGTANCRSRWRR